MLGNQIIKKRAVCNIQTALKKTFCLPHRVEVVDAFAVFVVDGLVVLIAAGDVVAYPDFRSAALGFDQLEIKVDER